MNENVEFFEISLDDPAWNKTVKSAYIYDFHHTSAYHRLELKPEESAVLLKFSQGVDFIAIPLIIRKVPHSTYSDATSVYGYCGPISSREVQELSHELISFFKVTIFQYFERNNIISVFSRLHPLVNQKQFFDDLGTTVDLNKTVAIDLRQPLDIQRQAYSRSYKNQINKLQKAKGYTTRLLQIDEIDKFIEIYYETMDRVAAQPYYYFSRNYFLEFLSNDSFEAQVIIAENEQGEVVSGSIFTITNGIMQYHLGGTRNEYLIDTPIKIVMDHARILGTERNLHFLHLGGGLGGSDQDSLFRFKVGFSKDLHQFSVWNLIVNSDLYTDLCNEKNINAEHFPNFFPLYRAE